jgi:hypothetical protein
MNKDKNGTWKISKGHKKRQRIRENDYTHCIVPIQVIRREGGEQLGKARKSQ